MQPCRGALDGAFPPARRGARSCATRACPPITRTMSPTARRCSAGSSRAFQIPCRRDRYTAKGGPDTWWPTPEPPHRINQIFLEPILFEHAASLERVTLLNRVEFSGFTQRRGGRHGIGARARYGRGAHRRGAIISSDATAADHRRGATSARSSSAIRSCSACNRAISARPRSCRSRKGRAPG